MSRSGLLVLAALLPVALSQLAGTNVAEVHPSLTWQKCTGTGVFHHRARRQLALASPRHQRIDELLHRKHWDATICPDGKTCAANCALDGGDYAGLMLFSPPSIVDPASGTYGITTSGNALTMKFVTVSQQPNIGSRVYLMTPGSTTTYQTFNFNNQEFTFDVDVSQLPCGLNGALYFAQMDADGGVAKSAGANKAGAKYGTGYCDAQCPRDIKFINGVANSAGWVPSPNDTNAGTGRAAQKWMSGKRTRSPQLTPRILAPLLDKVLALGPAVRHQTRTCDQAGCDFNSYRMGNTSFYGPGLTVDTSQKITVVTQFVGSPITSIKRFYVQNGKVIPNSMSTVPGATGNAISDSFCAAQKTAFGDTNTFASKGGMATMSRAASAGMVLVMSIWDDHAANMLWLDAPYPPTKAASSPGVTRGTCSPSSGAPKDVESASPNAQVVYSNIKFGPIGSTFNATGTT
ncbi:glycoside hydrolase [Mycena sp. CBHHK59/15]|nr:glycoside hydrolase [Mycena sp. CBHHK59/15]